MEKALITGANGFIGTALTDRLLREGVSVRAMCRSAERDNPLAQKGAEVVQGDVRDAELLKRYAVGCDVVFNLAAIGTGDWDTQHSINVEGASHVMDAAEGMGVQRFVHVSSIAVYGYEARGRVDENYPQRPPSNDYYMRTKSEGESLIWELAGKSNLEVVTVRPGYVYGPRSRTWSEAYYKRFQRHGYVMLAGGRGSAHPIYVDDVVDMLVTVAIHPKAPGHAFHATPDPAVKWRDYLGYYARMAGRTRERSIPLPPAFVLKPIANIMTLLAQRRGSYHDVYGAIRSVMRDVTFSMDKARLVLGWQPKTSLDDGMVPTERWLRQTSLELA